MGSGRAGASSLRNELLGLVLAVIVPLAALVAYILYDAARRELDYASLVARQMAVISADRALRYVDHVRTASCLP